MPRVSFFVIIRSIGNNVVISKCFRLNNNFAKQSPILYGTFKTKTGKKLKNLYR